MYLDCGYYYIYIHWTSILLTIHIPTIVFMTSVILCINNKHRHKVHHIRSAFSLFPRHPILELSFKHRRTHIFLSSHFLLSIGVVLREILQPLGSMTLGPLQWQAQCPIPVQLAQSSHGPRKTKQHSVILILGESIMP